MRAISLARNEQLRDKVYRHTFGVWRTKKFPVRPLVPYFFAASDFAFSCGRVWTQQHHKLLVGLYIYTVHKDPCNSFLLLKEQKRCISDCLDYIFQVVSVLIEARYLFHCCLSILRIEKLAVSYTDTTSTIADVFVHTPGRINMNSSINVWLKVRAVKRVGKNKKSNYTVSKKNSSYIYRTYT